jgi:hypothetical protein
MLLFALVLAWLAVVLWGFLADDFRPLEPPDVGRHNRDVDRDRSRQ